METLIEGLHQLWGVYFLPGAFFRPVAPLVDQVPKFALLDLSIEDLMDYILFMVLDMYWLGDGVGLGSMGKWVLSTWLQDNTWQMVYSEGLRQMELKSNRVDLSTLIELRNCWSSLRDVLHVEMFSWEPHFLAYRKSGTILLLWIHIPLLIFFFTISVWLFKFSWVWWIGCIQSEIARLEEITGSFWWNWDGTCNLHKKVGGALQ